MKNEVGIVISSIVSIISIAAVVALLFLGQGKDDKIKELEGIEHSKKSEFAANNENMNELNSEVAQLEAQLTTTETVLEEEAEEQIPEQQTPEQQASEQQASEQQTSEQYENQSTEAISIQGE